MIKHNSQRVHKGLMLGKHLIGSSSCKAGWASVVSSLKTSPWPVKGPELLKNSFNTLGKEEWACRCCITTYGAATRYILYNKGIYRGYCTCSRASSSVPFVALNLRHFWSCGYPIITCRTSVLSSRQCLPFFKLSLDNCLSIAETSRSIRWSLWVTLSHSESLWLSAKLRSLECLSTESPASGRSFTFGSGTWNPLVRLQAFGGDDMICIEDFQLSDHKAGNRKLLRFH